MNKRNACRQAGISTVKKVLSSIFAHKSLAEFLTSSNFAARRRRNNLYFQRTFVACRVTWHPRLTQQGRPAMWVG